MSKIPTVFEPKGAFNFLLSHIKEYNPTSRQTGILPHLKTFLADPIISDLLKDKKPANANSTPPHSSGIASTLSSLSRAVASMQKQLNTHLKDKARAAPTKAAPTASTTHKTYSAIAASRPPNPSLIVKLGGDGYIFKEGTQPSPGTICDILNQGLAKITPPQAYLAATRWTGCGNLVVTGDQNVTLKSLQTAAPHMSAILTAELHAPEDEPIPVAQPNIKWSKIALIANNPSYGLLLVTQHPSWVCPPTSYTQGSVSSLSVAFEDSDGSALRSLLATKYLYVHRHRVTVHKWKQRQPLHKGKSKAAAPAETSGSGSDDDTDDEDIEIHLTPMPTPETERPPATPGPPRATTSTVQTNQETTNKPATRSRQPNPPRSAKFKTSKAT